MRFSLFLSFTFVFVGCANLERRIEGSAEFPTWSPATQESIRGGAIDVGFSAQMVEVAWGRPDYRYIRRDERGTREIWRYAWTRSSSQFAGEGSFTDTSEFLDSTVEFVDGRVVAFEQRIKK